MRFRWPRLFGFDWVARLEVGGTTKEEKARTEEALDELRQMTDENQRRERAMKAEARQIERARRSRSK